MTVSTSQIKLFIHAATDAINDNAEEVTELDKAIGDGDHVTNLQRGLATLDALAGSLDELDWSTAFQKMGMSVMSTVGGASGSLYGTLFIAMGKAMKGKDMSLQSMADAFGQGVEAMKQRGRSDVGEKTMLDVLIPVANALREAAGQAQALHEVLATLNRVAGLGCESTRDMLPTKGRASFLGERAIGCIDAGARTGQLMIAAISGVLGEPTNYSGLS
ncbi:MAG: dihydroxyacetone kinase subunit DhaL [Candidatus Methylumidiphilus sp.]